MAVVLSPCLQSVIVALSSPIRAQFRQLLYVCQTMLKAEIAKQVATIGRNDIVVGYYKKAVDQLNNVLRPLESEMNLIPFSALKGCTEGTILQGNLLMIYFQKKSLSLDFGYKIAQNGFVSAYANQQYSNFNKALAKITDVIQSLDDLSLQTISLG